MKNGFDGLAVVAGGFEFVFVFALNFIVKD